MTDYLELLWNNVRSLVEGSVRVLMDYHTVVHCRAGRDTQRAIPSVLGFIAGGLRSAHSSYFPKLQCVLKARQLRGTLPLSLRTVHILRT